MSHRKKYNNIITLANLEDTDHCATIWLSIQDPVIMHVMLGLASEVMVL